MSRQINKLLADGHEALARSPSDPPAVRAIVAALLRDLRGTRR